MKRKAKKPVRNPKPIRGKGPVTNKQVNHAPMKPARSVTYERTRDYAQDEPPEQDPEATPSALAMLLDFAGPDDASGFDQ